MKRLPLIAIGLVLLSGLGCVKNESLTGGDAQSAMGSYAEGYNEIIDEVKSRIIKEYFDDIPEDGPQTMRRNLLFPQQGFVERSLTKAKEAFTAAKAAAPQSMAHLAALSDELLAASEAATAVYAEAQTYYEAENFKDDNGAKGREIHTRMLAAAERYHQAVDEFSTAIDSIEDEQLAADLRNFEGNKDYSYWFRKMMFESKKLLGTVSGAEEAPAWEAAFIRFDAVWADYTKFIESKGGKTKVVQVFQPFINMTERFATVAVRLRREAKAADPDTEKIDQEIEELVSAYNYVVDMSNTLYEVEPYGQLK